MRLSRLFIRSLVLCLGLFPQVMFSSPAPAPASVYETLNQIISDFHGKVALAAENLATGEIVEVLGAQQVQTASVIKLPIMVEAFYQIQAGRIHLQDRLIEKKENRVKGSGILQDLSEGLNPTLEDAITLMIVLSDNTATNMVIDTVGIDPVNGEMQKLGLQDTRLFKKVFIPSAHPSEGEKKFGLGVTTPRDMLKLLVLLAQGRLVDQASSEKMISILKKQRDQDGIPRYITYDSQKLSSTGVQVANKTGALDDVRNDVGLVYTKSGVYAMAIFTWNSSDKRWTADNAATLTIARLAKALADHFGAGSQ